MRYRYDHRVAIAGLVVGAVILVGGLLTGNRDTAGAISLATIVTSPWSPTSASPAGPAASRPGAADGQAGVVSARTAMAALRPLRAITDPAGWVAAPHR